MAMLKDEVSICKAVCMKIDEDTGLLATLQYHTERNDQGKIDHEKSKYRWIARVFKMADMKAEIINLKSDENALKKYRWPDDPDPWFICVNNGNDGRCAAKFYMTKMNKIKSWEDGQEVLKGFVTKTAKREEGYNTNAAYATDAYTATNGDTLDLTDKAALLAHVGQTLYRNQQMKSKLGKAIKMVATN